MNNELEPRLLPAVQTALSRGEPVVALESTVIAHGLPSPANFETALAIEEAVRTHGAIPATIAVLKGELHIGLDEDQIHHLATSSFRKLSIRDLPVAMAERVDGATTVASSIFLAHRAGIKVFSTGGIGGIHRGGGGDVSADLPQLARTPIVTVCSGIKIVLDLPATREWLETHGVTVIGYKCDQVPAFYSRQSGLDVDARVETAEDAAQIFMAQRQLGFSSTLLVTVPVPEEAEVPSRILEDALEQALDQAAAQKIEGRNLTPFLLSQMVERTRGATLTANIALLKNNGEVAAQIAVALARRKDWL